MSGNNIHYIDIKYIKNGLHLREEKQPPPASPILKSKNGGGVACG
jgi:hypothetical protein